MPSVGTAWVTIRVNTKGFEAGLDKMLARLSKKMEAGGKKLGDDMAKGMKSSNVEKFFRDMELRAQTASTKMRNDFKKVEGALDDVGLTASDAGDMVNKSFADISPSLRAVRGDLNELGRATRDVEKEAGSASRAVGDIGRSGSRGVRAAANDVGFFKSALLNLSKEGVGVRDMLAGFHDTLATVGTGISGLIGGLSAVGQGLFAVGSQAAAAAPSLGIFAAGLIGIGQVAGVLAIAMHGVGAAITAGFKSASTSATAAAGSTKDLGAAIAAAARAVRDAKQNLQDAYAAAARAAADAARRTLDAERQLAQSEQALIQTQKDLNAAREEGLRQLRDIGFAAEDASLGEQRAALNLQDARMKLQEVSELPPDDRARVEAELAYKEAELNYREAKASRQDADKQQKDSVKKGLQGTDAMVAAHNAEHDAQAQVTQDKRDLADARRNEAQVAEDSARRIRDAQQSLADAEKALADARKKGTAATQAAKTAADAYAAALKKLSPKQQQFVKDLIKLGPVFKQARNQIADPLFGPLDDALNSLVGSPFWNQIVNRLTTTSGELGKLVAAGADAAKKPPFSTALLSTMDSNNKALGTFGQAAGNLANAFVQIADASGPVLNDFAEWIKKVTGAWSQTTTLDNRTGKLDATIKRAGARVAVFKDFFVELWHWLRKVGGAATDASENFKWTKDGASKKGYIPMLTEHLKEFNKKLDHGKMVDDFHTALDNMSAAGRAVKSAVVDPLLALGRDKRLAGAFDTIAKSDAFTRLAANGGEAAQQLAILVTNVADIAAVLTQSGSFATFLNILGKITGTISSFLDKVPVPVLQAFGTALGVLAAIRVTTTVGSKLAAALTPPGLDKLPGRIRKIAPKIAEAGATVQAAGGDIAAGFQLSLAEGFKEVGRQGYTAAKSAFKTIKSAIGEDDGTKAGRDLMAGIALGIEAGLEGVVVASTEAGKAIIAAMKRAMGERSPSVLTAQAGRDLMAGLALGIEEGEAGAVAAGESAGLATGAAVKEGAAVGGAGAGAGVGAAGGIGGAVAAEAGPVGKFAGILGKFGKFAGPLTKLMKPLSLGIRAIGGAMRFAMGPWGVLILTLLPLLWPLLKKLNDKFHIVDKTMAAVKWTLGKVGDAFKWLWGKITDLFDWVKSNWPLLLGILTGPIGLAVVLIVKNWQKIWDTVTKFVGKIKDKITGIWDGIVNAWHHVQTFLTGLWSHHIKPWILGLIVKVHDKEWAFFHGIVDAWHSFNQFMGDLWPKYIKPWIVGLILFVGNQELKFFHGIITAWNAVFTWLKNLWSDHVKPWLGGFVDDFSTGISKIWQGLIDGFFSAIDWVTGKINTYLVDPLNSLLSHLHVGFSIDQIPDIKGQKLTLAGGGPVKGPGTSTSDSVPAMLSRGEYVLRAKAAQKLGIPVLNALNDNGSLPMGDPGLFHAIGSAYHSVTGAIQHGATTAIKWVLSKAEGFFNNQDLFSQLIKGIIMSAANGAVDWVHTKEQDVNAAQNGGANVAVADPDSPHSISSWHGGLFSKRFIAHLKKAQQLSGNYIYVIQGGYEPATSYSGTSHRGDAIDTKVIYSVLYALRRVGIAAGDRTGLGNWAPHIHAIPGPSAGYGAGSAVWQWQDYLAKGGRKQSPRSPWGLALGGVVHPVPGGTLVHIAEAGRAERVTPLDSEGMTPAERRILASLDAQFTGGSGGDTYNVHPAPGMDETALADKVVRRVAWNRRRGVGRG